MIYRNAFFQLVMKDEGIYVKIFPARNGGKSLDFEELTNYLNTKKITFDLTNLHAQVVMAREPILVRLCDGKTYPENEKLYVKISADKMTVIGRFIPPSTGGNTMKKEDIVSDLAFHNVKFGVDNAVIEEWLKNREYCSDIILAKGKEVRNGSDAEITYHFRTDKSVKPRQNEDGSVDFHDLSVISKVNKGDILASLKREDPGDPGMTVMGEVIKPRTVKHLVLRHGKNISVSEDGLIMTSDVSGHACLEDDQVFVSDTYEVPANVDNSTGDIDYDGNVEVKGNVITGFVVKATGDVIVNGVVEGGVIEAGGQIILKRGIQGMGKGRLKAGGNVVAKFIENSDVSAGGYVTTDAIMHSNVSARGEIKVEGKKGFVTGGTIRSGSSIVVKTAGSTMGTKTVLEVGLEPEKIDEFHSTEKRIEDLSKERTQGVQLIALFKKKIDKGEKLAPDKLLQYKLAISNHKKISDEIDLLQERYNQLKEEMENFNSGFISVKGTSYNGVKIVISDASYYVRKDTDYCKFIKENGDIRITGI